MVSKVKSYTFSLLSSIAVAASFPTVSYCLESPVRELERDFTKVAKQATPAVVSIQVKAVAKNKYSFRQGDTYEFNYPFELFDDDFLNRLFGGRKNESQAVLGQASGFLISADGTILTNNHVVQNASEIVAILNDGREFKAKVIGKDPSTDLAIIKIDGHDLPFITLGDSEKLEVGQWVVAIGNSLGLQATLTVGVVSAKGRNNLDVARFEDFIQTDAAINQGNSGGPLINLDGKVVGINTAIATNYGGYMGVGFAIPSNMAKQIIDQILNDGKVTRGSIGVYLQRVDNDLAHAFDLTRPEGALIADVIKGSAAEKAGLKPGDIIMKYNEQQVDNIATLRNAIALMKPGTKVTLTILRDKKQMQLPVEIGNSEDTDLAVENKISANLLGIEVTNIDAEKAKKLGLQEEAGVIITKVDPNGLGALAGLKKETVILTVNKTPIDSVEHFNKLLTESEPGKPILLFVKQGESMRFISIRKQ